MEGWYTRRESGQTQYTPMQTIQVHDPRALEDLFTYAPKEIVEKILLDMDLEGFMHTCEMNSRIWEICSNIRKKYYDVHSKEIIRDLEEYPETKSYKLWIDLASSEIDWNEIHNKFVLSEDFIREFQDHLDWKLISKQEDELSEDFIREFQHRVDWREISKHQDLSEDFIRDFEDDVDWREISKHQNLSEDFIRDFEDKVDWERIVKNQRLSGDFIREFQDKVDWIDISYYQTLSEDFIREFKDRVHWIMIRNRGYWTDFSKKFKKEFREKLEY